MNKSKEENVVKQYEANGNTCEGVNPEEIKLIDLHCKYVGEINNSNKFINDLAVKAVSNGDISIKPRMDKSEIKSIVRSMVRVNFDRPMRVVISKDGRLWADNTRTCIAYVIMYGINAVLTDVPFYIVDTRGDNPYIVDYNGSVKENNSDINFVIAKSQQINRLIERDFRPLTVTWKISDLMNNLGYSI